MIAASSRIGSLFSGIGGLELGLEMCGLGPVVWQAECDPYARAVLAKHWPTVKRFDDVKEIDHEAPPVDLVCGGFPCQDISNAGNRAGIDGERSGLWSEYARILRVVRPRYVFVENVAALIARGMERVLGDLAALGFDAEWGVFRASDVGAPHRRERVFILAHARRIGEHGLQPITVTRGGGAAIAGNDRGAVADTASIGRREGRPESEREGEACSCGDGCMAHADEHGPPGERRDVPEDGHAPAGRDADRCGGAHSFPPGPDRISEWDGPKPAIRRGADGTANRVDRLRCLGNAVVPQQAALAFMTLKRRIEGKCSRGHELPHPPGHSCSEW